MSKVNAAYATEEAKDEVGKVNVPSRWAQARLVYQIDSPTPCGKTEVLQRLASPTSLFTKACAVQRGIACAPRLGFNVCLFFCRWYPSPQWLAAPLHRSLHHSETDEGNPTRLVAKMHILVANMFIIIITVYVVYVSFLHYSNVILVSCLFSLFSHMRWCMRILKMYIDMCLRRHTHTYNCRAHQPGPNGSH